MVKLAEDASSWIQKALQSDASAKAIDLGQLYRRNCHWLDMYQEEPPSCCPAQQIYMCGIGNGSAKPTEIAPQSASDTTR